MTTRTSRTPDPFSRVAKRRGVRLRAPALAQAIGEDASTILELQLPPEVQTETADICIYFNGQLCCLFSTGWYCVDGKECNYEYNSNTRRTEKICWLTLSPAGTQPAPPPPRPRPPASAISVGFTWNGSQPFIMGSVFGGYGQPGYDIPAWGGIPQYGGASYNYVPYAWWGYQNHCPAAYGPGGLGGCQGAPR